MRNLDVAESIFSRLVPDDRQYVIPVWQRVYSWYTSQWSELWDDLRNLYEKTQKEQPKEFSKSPSHFMGSIVVKPKSLGAIERFILIDGQLRLTTLMIILAILRDEAKNSHKNDLSKAIEDKYLFNTYACLLYTSDAADE